MKGYINDGICYIFPQEVAQIPEVEADFYYVQQEDYAAWVTANESLADKIVKYNFNILAAKAKVFAGHTDDDLEPAQKEDPELAWSAESATAQIGETNTFPTLTNPHSVTVSYSSSDNTKASIDASTGEITLVAEGNATISAVFAGDDTYEAQTVTYTLTVQAAKVSPELAWSEDTCTVVLDGANVYPTLSNPYGVTPLDFSSDDESVATINENGEVTLVAEGNATISAVFAGDDTYEAQTVTYTLTVQAAQVPTTYSFNIDEEGNLSNIGSYEEGDNVQYTFDHALQQDQPGMWHWEYTMSPASLVDYNFSQGTPAWTDNNDPDNPIEWPEEPAEISFTMPASDVLYTITKVYDEPEQPE